MSFDHREVWQGAFRGWGGWRWARTGTERRDRQRVGWVLVGTDPKGREWSVGEVYGSRAVLVHPVETIVGRGAAVKRVKALRRVFGGPTLAKAWLERAVTLERPNWS